MLYDQPIGIEGAAARVVGRGARGHPRRRGREPGARDGLLHPPRAAGRRQRPRASPTPGYPPSPGCAPAWCARPRCGTPPATRRACAASPRAAAPVRTGAGPLAEHEAKELLRAAGVPVVEGRLAAGEEDAAGAMDELGPALGAEALVPHARCTRASCAPWRSTCAARRTCARPTVAWWHSGSTAPPCSWSKWRRPAWSCSCPPGATPWCPRWWWASGGVWTEIHDDVAVVPLPATPERVEAALRSLRGAGILTGARGGTPLDLAAAARLGAAVGDLLLAEGLGLIELNPVLVHEHGALAVDALGRLASAVRKGVLPRLVTKPDGAAAGGGPSAPRLLCCPWCSSAPIPEPRRPGHAAGRLRALIRARGTVLGHPPPPVRGGPALRRAADGDEPPVPAR